MRKATVLLIIILLVLSFSGLVYYAATHSRGVPFVAEKIERPLLKVPFIDNGIDLSQDISRGIWDSMPSKEIKLMYQVMVLPWPKTVVPSVIVKAFHNGKDIYFYMSWKDDTEDRILEINRFSDACAIMFPLGKEVQTSTLMMGFLGKANIWHWKASQDKEYWLGESPKTEAYADFYYPFEETELFPVSKTVPKSAVNDLVAVRVGTVTPKETQGIEGRGFWENGVWRVVFKRPIAPVDMEEDAVFKLREKKLCAFAVWNGSKGDRGGRKSISDWVEVRVH